MSRVFLVTQSWKLGCIPKGLLEVGTRSALNPTFTGVQPSPLLHGASERATDMLNFLKGYSCRARAMD